LIDRPIAAMQYHGRMTLQLEPGTTYGAFRIQRVLRKHPAAWVYAVHVAGRDELCDLELSLDPVQSEETARRVLREIAVLGNLTNRHVVDVLDSGMGEGDHWFVLAEHLEGARLHEWHDFDEPLPAADAARLIHHACLGLAELHALGIVHRDIKPEALWVEPDGTLKIMDFSSARSWGTEATGDNVTVGLVVAGRPQYAAPEQMGTSELTPASDVYSLGVILYEMLSGRSPVFPDRPRSAAHRDLADDPAAWFRAHVAKEPGLLSDQSACIDVPEKLCALVMRCLAKDPGARPENGAALANELGWILHHDLGAAQAAILRSRIGDTDSKFHLVLPGSHGLGSDGALLRRTDAEPSAVLEWAGGSEPADIVPRSGRVTMNGVLLTERTALPPGAPFQIDGTPVSLTYPR
jgi:serine/threonine-protein kinase